MHLFFGLNGPFQANITIQNMSTKSHVLMHLLARIFISSLSSFEAKFNKFYYHRYKMTEDFLIQGRPENINIFK